MTTQGCVVIQGTPPAGQVPIRKSPYRPDYIASDLAHIHPQTSLPSQGKRQTPPNPRAAPCPYRPPSIASSLECIRTVSAMLDGDVETPRLPWWGLGRSRVRDGNTLDAINLVATALRAFLARLRRPPGLSY